jgi:hypothetical protein
MQPQKVLVLCFVLIIAITLLALGRSLVPQWPSVFGHSGTISPRDMKDIWGGADEKCWQSRNTCSGTSSFCYVVPYIDPDTNPKPCAISSQRVYNTNEYFDCAMGPGDNDEHCGEPTTVYCAEDKKCLTNVTRGAAPEILWPALSGFERPKVR